MTLPDKTGTCPCGEIIDIPVMLNPHPLSSSDKYRYDVCDIECPECGRRSGGGNMGDGTVDSWMTARQIAESEAEYERQCFDSDMNEFYGRGEW